MAAQYSREAPRREAESGHRKLNEHVHRGGPASLARSVQSNTMDPASQHASPIGWQSDIGDGHASTVPTSGN